MTPLPAPRIKNRVVNLFPGRPFRAPLWWCAAHKLIFFFHSSSYRSDAFERRLPSESHCQRARFEGTKKPIGGLLTSIDILSLDRHALWRPAKLVRLPPGGQHFL